MNDLTKILSTEFPGNLTVFVDKLDFILRWLTETTGWDNYCDEHINIIRRIENPGICPEQYSYEITLNKTGMSVFLFEERTPFVADKLKRYRHGENWLKYVDILYESAKKAEKIYLGDCYQPLTRSEDIDCNVISWFQNS